MNSWLAACLTMESHWPPQMSVWQDGTLLALTMIPTSSVREKASVCKYYTPCRINASLQHLHFDWMLFNVMGVYIMHNISVTDAYRRSGICSNDVISNAVIPGNGTSQPECEAHCFATTGCQSYGYSIDGCFPRRKSCDSPTWPAYGAFEFCIGTSKYFVEVILSLIRPITIDR